MKTLILLCLLPTLAMAKMQYEVPVASELKEFATFEINDFVRTVKGDEVTIGYTLPRVLTGSLVYIELKGKVTSQDSESIMVGDKGLANCDREYRKCTIEYFNLSFDQEKAKELIEGISQSPFETAARLEVMRVFSTDPVGIVTY